MENERGNFDKSDFEKEVAEVSSWFRKDKKDAVVETTGAERSSAALEANAEIGKGGIVAARGTGEGLVLRLDGRVDQKSLKGALIEFISARDSFLNGQDIALEWVGVLPAEEQVQEFKEILAEKFGIKVKSSALSEHKRRIVEQVETVAMPDPSAGRSPASQHSSGLFGGIDRLGLSACTPMEEPSVKEEYGLDVLSNKKENAAVRTALWDDPDARMVYGMLRSGQRVESEHSVVIIGDVNSGAEIVAGGDIIVLGILRGVAHAGAYDETGGGRFIFALDLRPTQLRIGSVISRGAAEGAKRPEIARVDGNMIVVEPFQARNVLSRLRGL